MRKIEIIFKAKKAHLPLGENIIFKKDIGSLDLKYLCSYITFGSVILFHMLLWSDDLKRLVIPEYCKYYIAYLV